MRQLRVFFIILALGIPFKFAFGDTDYYSSSYARLSYVKGDVFIQRADDMGYEEAVVNLLLIEGDTLGSRDGRAEIHFGGRNYLRVDRNTQIYLAGLPKRGEELKKIHIQEGSCYLRINRMEWEGEVEIHTPDASFYVIEEGLYRIDVFEAGETVLSVYEGKIEAAGEMGSHYAEKGNSLVARNGRLEFTRLAGMYDDFAEWNRARDNIYANRIRRYYLPSDLYEYEAELAYYGSWQYVYPYGNVWIPRVSDGWRPYYHGRWVWYPILGWTWVSYDPWGWCVSRYGRWHWKFGLGWYWIPTRVWGPAWVHWYHGYDHIGWCPLSYYNRPVVIINNHFSDRYHGYGYPYRSHALTIIHKSQLQSRHLKKVALSRDRISKLGSIKLSSRQPMVKYRADRVGAHNLKAAKIFSKSRSRGVLKNYKSGSGSPGIRSPNSRIRNPAGKSVFPSRARSGKKTVSSGNLSRSNSSPKERSYSSRLAKDSSRKSPAASRKNVRKAYPSRSTSSESRYNSKKYTGSFRNERSVPPRDEAKVRSYDYKKKSGNTSSDLNRSRSSRIPKTYSSQSESRKKPSSYTAGKSDIRQRGSYYSPDSGKSRSSRNRYSSAAPRTKSYSKPKYSRSTSNVRKPSSSYSSPPSIRSSEKITSRPSITRSKSSSSSRPSVTRSKSSSRSRSSVTRSKSSSSSRSKSKSRSSRSSGKSKKKN